MLHFYDIAFLFFHEYIHGVGVNKLKCMALEAEELQRRAYHRHQSVFLGPRSGLYSSKHSSTGSSSPSLHVHLASASAFDINNVTFESSLKPPIREGGFLEPHSGWAVGTVLQTQLSLELMGGLGVCAQVTGP